jgi:hypothetical protein
VRLQQVNQRVPQVWPVCIAPHVKLVDSKVSRHFFDRRALFELAVLVEGKMRRGGQVNPSEQFDYLFDSIGGRAFRFGWEWKCGCKADKIFQMHFVFLGRVHVGSDRRVRDNVHGYPADNFQWIVGPQQFAQLFNCSRDALSRPRCHTGPVRTFFHAAMSLSSRDRQAILEITLSGDPITRNLAQPAFQRPSSMPI